MKQKWKVLSGNLVAAEVYKRDRIGPDMLQRRFHSGRGAMRETSEIMGDRTIFAFGALWPTWRPGWWEVGTLWVHESHRGNGLTSEILGELIERAPHGSQLVLFTEEQRVVRVLGRHGFYFVTTQTMPNVLRLASELGIVERLPENIHDGAIAPEPCVRSLFVR